MSTDPGKKELLISYETGGVENYGPNGYFSKGNLDALRIITNSLVDNAIGLSSDSREGFTRVALVPLSSPKLKGVSELTKRFGLNNVAVCIAFQGIEADKYNREPTMRGIAIMSVEEARKFIDGIQTQPEKVYELIREINNGPVTRYDGTPLSIRTGICVEILANTSIGGNIEKPIKTRPFPSSFNPNPLF
jgi:hypothetical protein